MGSKRKTSKIFGLGSGPAKGKRTSTRCGRPTVNFMIRRKRIKRKSLPLSLVLKRIKQTTISKRKNTKECHKFFTSELLENGLKLKIRERTMHNLSPQGYRFVNLDSLQGHVSEITMHVCLCPSAIELSSKNQSPIKLVSEERKLGLATVLCAQCEGCHKQFKFCTSPSLPESKRFDVNVRAVWGSIATGNGPSHLNEIMGTMNSPGLSSTSFSAIEQEVGEWWLAALQENMLQVGAEERRIAMENGFFHQGIPAITVITDGGWSKRTHKHSYNALGGVAIIIGQATKKLLHIGVRNKYCYVCSTAEKVNTIPTEHTCFKNWSEDSQSMEADIVLEGFKQAESKHGLRYIRVVGDGDSSVYARIREEVPGWGRYVEKEECANHTCKCFRSNLEKLVSENHLYKGRNHLTKTTRVRLVSALRSAIRMRSKDVETNHLTKPEAISQLRHDIKNSVFHVFGLHSNCSNFCKARDNVNPITHDHHVIPPDQPVEETLDIFEEQEKLWSEGSSLAAQEEARGESSIEYSNVEQYIIQDVTSILNRIAEKAHRLISNTTTNLAENWMRIRTKFDGGKIYNLCNRGSWHGRCFGGGLRMNFGPKWSPIVWEQATATKAGKFFDEYYARHEKNLISSRKYKSKPDTQQLRWKRKMKACKQSNSKKARQSYGTEAMDYTPDISPSDLSNTKDKYIQTHINIGIPQMNAITNSTSQQSLSGLWHTERRKRLTASNFGPIIRRNPSLKVLNLVKNLLYSTFKGNRHTRNGLLQERTSIEEYTLKKAEQHENVTVKSTGLLIAHEHPFLAASADGIVSTGSGDGLLEIKNLLHNKPVNLYQASEKSSFCLETVSGHLNLKSTHNYFYQCHGLMNICNYPWIDFVVRTLNPHQLFIQRIFRDNTLWENIMLPKLKAFYFNAILPELCSPRNGKSPGIREPGIWYIAPECTQPGKKTTGRKKKNTAKQNNDFVSEANIEPSAEQTPCTRRRGRPRLVKFLDKRIEHKWIVDNTSEWYKGTVLSVKSGKDGVKGAIYEVLYDSDDNPYEINHLVEDYRSESVRFIDV
ncbi:uncharacterized protein LOC134696586 isoform X2 [Mytilus trossulus]|uniref:uncharacterized protein LOC134696362 isoform X2 n=1 Tax=Mytilus trossulus TaxID=6551 RepID=UPI0030076C71